MYPVRVHTIGEVSVTSEATAYGGASAVVSIANVVSHCVGPYAVDNASDAFEQVETPWLAPGTCRGCAEAGGWGAASCTVQEESGPCVPSPVRHQALADPTFTLDQAAPSGSRVTAGR